MEYANARLYHVILNFAVLAVKKQFTKNKQK